MTTEQKLGMTFSHQLLIAQSL